MLLVSVCEIILEITVEDVFVEMLLINLYRISSKATSEESESVRSSESGRKLASMLVGGILSLETLETFEYLS